MLPKPCVARAPFMLVSCFTARGGRGALTRDTRGRNLPPEHRPWTFCRHVELSEGKDELAAMRLVESQGYCLFHYRA